MRSSQCPRLSRQISRYTAMYTHLDDEAIARLRREHVCAECSEWRPRRWLARQPEDDPRGQR